MSPETSWPPQVGKPLPLAGEAYAEPEKLAWILSEEGHGREWARVLRIDENDAQRFWEAIKRAVIEARIFKVTEEFGIVCGVEVSLTIGRRAANARIFWHYERAGDAPRLVTTYPRL